MSACKHEWYLKDGRGYVFCGVCGKTVPVENYFEQLGQENADLRAKLEAEQIRYKSAIRIAKRIKDQRDNLQAQVKQLATNDKLSWDRVLEANTEIADLQAQVGVLRRALEEICRQVDFSARARGGKRKVATIPTGLTRQCSLERAIEEADYILATTPEQAGERVRGLVEALESIVKTLDQSFLTTREKHVCDTAREALAKYRGGAANG